MILDITIILLFLGFVFLGFKIGFFSTVLKITSALSGIILALCLTKPTTNLMINWDVGNKLEEKIYTNITTSDAFAAYVEGGEGVDGIDFLLEELGVPSFMSSFIAPKIAENVEPLEAAREVAGSIRYICVFILTFIALAICSSIIFFVLKLIIKAIRKWKLFRTVDGLLGILFYILLFFLFIYTTFLIISIVMHSGSPDSGFVKFMENQLHLDDEEFGVAKYLFKNNIIGNFFQLIF